MYRFIILLLPLTLLSCKKLGKKEPTSVYVTVTDRISGEYIPFSFCEVLENVTSLDNAYDHSGPYSFSFDALANDSYTYSLHAFVDPYVYHDIEMENTITLEKGAHNEFHFEAVPKGQITYDFENVDCYDDNDLLEFYEKNLEVPEENSLVPWTFNGCYDHEFNWGADPMGTYELEWHVTKNGITEVFYDTIYLNAGDTIVYELNY